MRSDDQSKPKALYRKFVETSGAVEIEQNHRIVVYFNRRNHNPILRDAELDQANPKTPWLGNRRLTFVYTRPLQIVIELTSAEIGH